MKRFITTSALCIAFAALSVHDQVHAQAGAAVEVAGPYIGTAFGAAFGNREIDDSNSSNDERIGRSAKIFGGYQITENFGVQAGYVRMQALNQNTGSGLTLVNRTVNGHSGYVAGTARLPLGQSRTDRQGRRFLRQGHRRQALAARYLQEHQRAAATVPAQGHRPKRLQSRRS